MLVATRKMPPSIIASHQAFRCERRFSGDNAEIKTPYSKARDCRALPERRRRSPRGQRRMPRDASNMLMIVTMSGLSTDGILRQR